MKVKYKIMEIYCLRCKAKKEIESPEIVTITVKGKERKMAKAVCPDCGTKINKFLPKDYAN